MKRYIYAIFSAAILMLATGCEDFLDRPQLDKVVDNNFWRNESDFRTYSVEFYPWFFAGYNTSYSVQYTPLRGYTFNDDLSGTSTQENFISNIPSTVAQTKAPSQLLNGDWYRQFNGEMWNFGWVRKANVMIQKVEQYKGNLSEAAYKHWMAVGRFFRAYAYYNLVVSFGDVPYFDKPVEESNLVEMYKDRDGRATVMNHVYDDLKYAIDNAYEMDNGSSQYVNKYAIAALASRIMLFEGTWEKYHHTTNGEPAKFLKFCVDASEVVMNTHKYSCSQDFRSIFGSQNLAKHPEVIFYRTYAAAMATHAVASYSNGTESQDKAANLQLIKSFICNDGKPYKTSSIVNAADFSLSELAKTRDPRFEASFFITPQKASSTLLYCDKFISREGAAFITHSADRPLQYKDASNENDAPIIRYAEVLLDWIEAKEELAESYGGSAVSQNDIDISINQIRKRPLDRDAQMNGVHQTAPLSLAFLSDDPDRDADVSALLWEIRRERRMEFVFEHTRLLDIKRWAKINYMDNTKYPDTMFGTWVDFPKELPDFLVPENEGKLVVRKADGTLVTYQKGGTNKSEMVGFYMINLVKPRDAFNEEKVYVSPVGTQEIQKYADHGFTLTQTAAWR
jgi:starch-binding outer membrane protein, SusD/RagB family